VANKFQEALEASQSEMSCEDFLREHLTTVQAALVIASEKYKESKRK